MTAISHKNAISQFADVIWGAHAAQCHW